MPSTPEPQRRAGWPGPDQGETECENTLPSSGRARSADISAASRTEIGELNGLIVQKAKDAGCPAPTHERIVEIVRRIERGAVTPRPELLFDA